MNLILKKDVSNLGRFGAQVRVAEGYARNYLIPQGLAVPVTPAAIKQFAAEKDAHLKKMQVRKD
ncbi:MAG: 50S ribosomal protein L9, partial [Deltaproteobacteria bacterium]|nr:50S ribosomal protein L9 [Deltaproteobacteria bacterium]